MANANLGWARIPAILSVPDTAGFSETYGFGAASGMVWLEGQYLIPHGRASKTLYLFMHPSSTLQLLPMPAALVGAGLHVLCAASRYPKNDSGLIIEKVAIDMGAWIKDAQSRGYEKVILVGWSGGGSLSLFYQAEAEAPSITATPAGDVVDLDRPESWLREGYPCWLVGGRFALPILSSGSGGAVDHRYAGGRCRGPDARRSLNRPTASSSLPRICRAPRH